MEGSFNVANTVYVVRDGLPKVRFEGQLLAQVTTESHPPRWIELELYRVRKILHPADQVAPRYFLYIVGRSVVYHQHDSECNTGVPMRWSSLRREEAEACPRCRPAQIAETPAEDPSEAPALVDMEANRHTLHRLDTAAAIVQRLMEGKLPKNTGKLSAPAERLLRKAALVELEIAQAIDLDSGVVSDDTYEQEDIAR